MKPILLALLLCGLTALGQTSGDKATPKSGKSTPKKHRELPAFKQSVYADSWDIGEIKDCTTYSGNPYLLLCETTKSSWPESLINLVTKNIVAMSEDKAYERALITARVRSKDYMVKFFDDEGRNPEPWPEPQTGRKITEWNCTKGTMISCSLVGRQD